jgi:4-amino-4-deoxy-L-arabinose transferase-like glycosyltransferase
MMGVMERQSSLRPIGGRLGAHAWAGAPGSRTVALALAGLTTLAALALLALLARAVTTSTIPFDTDEANHAVDGWEVYYALAQRAPGELYTAVTGQGFYPPVHSFFVAVAYAVMGPTLAASRLPTVVNFALSLLLLGWFTLWLARRGLIGHPVGHWWALAAASCAVAFAITSPVYIGAAVLVMQEITGALLGLVLLLLAHAAGQTPHGRSWWLKLAAAALVATALCLTKYSFGLFFLPGLAAGLITATLPWRAERRAWWSLLLVLAIYGLVLGLWWLVTDRASLLLFFTDHPHYAPILSQANLLYLFRLWFAQYAVTPLLAGMSAGLAVVGAIWGWRWLAVRVAVWSILAAVVVLTISPTDEPRHFVPVAPALWGLAGLGLAVLLQRLWQQTGSELAPSAALIGLLLLLVIGSIQPARSLPTVLHRQFEGTPALLALHDFALQRVDLTRPVLLLGDFNDQNNLLAIRWRAATQSQRSLWALAVDYFPFENHEHSLNRTRRKPQIATVDPTFPRQHMNEVLARNHYAYLVELKQLDDYFGPRSANPADPLCPYPTVEEQVADWIVIVYDITAAERNRCAG